MSQNFTDTTCVNINENEVSSRQNEYIGPKKKNFLYSKCLLCISIFRWFPVLFIFSVTLWSYYAYIYQLCIVTIESTFIKSSYIIVFNFLYFMTLWSYFKTVFTKSSVAPTAFHLKTSDYGRIIKESTEERKNTVLFEILKEKQLSLSCRTFSSSIRLCSKCNLIKPDRAHHCSICNACILKMDHHCPWLNNCVSFSNYKYFILFLGYSFLMCLFGAITSFPYFLLFWSNQSPTLGKFNILFLFFVSIMFSISLFSLFFYHIYLVLRNLTTLENFRTPLFVYGPNKNAFNLGKYNNFKEVFGEKKLLWFLPVYTSLGDGIEYPCSEEHAKQLTQRLSHLKQPQTTKLDNTEYSYNENISAVKPKNEFTNSVIEEFSIQIPGTTTAN